MPDRPFPQASPPPRSLRCLRFLTPHFQGWKLNFDLTIFMGLKGHCDFHSARDNPFSSRKLTHVESSSHQHGGQRARPPAAMEGELEGRVETKGRGEEG